MAHVPPSLGKTGKEVFQEWRRLSEKPQYPTALVVGWVICGGIFSWRDGVIQRQFTHPGKYGKIATIRPATPQEIEEIHHAIDIGAFQVEARNATGALGLCRKPDAGKTTWVYHQSTGTPPAPDE